MKSIGFLLASSAYAVDVYFKTKPSPEGEYLAPSYVGSRTFEPVYLTKTDGADVNIKCIVIKSNGRAGCSCGLTVKVAFQKDLLIRCPPKRGHVISLLQEVHIEEKGFVEAVMGLVLIHGIDAVATGGPGAKLLKEEATYPCTTSLRVSTEPIQLKRPTHFPLIPIVHPIDGLYSTPIWNIPPPAWAAQIASLKVPGIALMYSKCQTARSGDRLSCHCLLQWTSSTLAAKKVIVCSPRKGDFITVTDSTIPALMDCNVSLEDGFIRKYDRLQTKLSQTQLISSRQAMTSRSWPCHTVVTSKYVAPFIPLPSTMLDPETLFDLENTVRPSDSATGVFDDETVHLIAPVIRRDSKRKREVISSDTKSTESGSSTRKSISSSTIDFDLESDESPKTDMDIFKDLVFDGEGVKYVGNPKDDPFAPEHLYSL